MLDGICVTENGGLRVAMDPTALSTIADTEARLGSKMSKCVCTLVGTVEEDGVVDVADAFPVILSFSPNSENQPDNPQIIKEHHEKAFQLRQHAHPREIVLGWATTEKDLSIHNSLAEWYKSEPRSTKFVPSKHLTSPVYVVVNLPRPDSLKYTMEAYCKGPLSLCFRYVPIYVKPQSPAEMSILARMNVRMAQSLNFDINTQFNSRCHDYSLTSIAEQIGMASRYIAAVREKRITGDVEIGRTLARCFSSTSRFDITSLDKAQAEECLLVSYICHLAKLQFALAEKLAA